MSKGNKFAVLVHGPGFWPYVRMFNDRPGYVATRDFDEADAVCFTGGSDVEPRRYGEFPLPTTYSDRTRDQSDLYMTNRANQAGKMLIGICRGGQWLNVFNGGRLWQDIDGHTVSHDVTDMVHGEIVRVTSTHHQEMIPTDDANILAIARVASEKRSAKAKLRGLGATSEPDIEAVFYPMSKSFCFQPHPEFDVNYGTRELFFNLLEHSRAA